ncbi:MAG: GNAT family N-acetyltransferase [Candidatus Eremiobacteraeota bacterium]|nr:GNAT family N-acetyltransferase [Candidatus Eremiobacteraeota bacterium]
MSELGIQTERLRMRRLGQQDVDALFAMFQDPGAMRYYPGLKDRAETQAWLDWSERSWAEHRTGFFALERLSDGAFVGQCGPLPQHVDVRFDYEVGYLLASEHWGHGYATEAARGARDWVFRTFDADRVVSFIDPRNAPSIAVAERNDMRLLKQRRAERWNRDILIYGISRAEWKQLQKT